MAFEVLDEHEQGELVQKWLRENAMSIAIGIALGLLLIFGWQQWKVHRQRQTADAAAQYQSLVDAVEAKRNDDATKIADALRKDYSSSTYAVLASLREAEMADAKGDLAKSAESLGWAEAHAGVPALKALAGLRLARVKVAQGDADGALKQLDGLPKDDYSALASDLRGDILVKLGRDGDARAAYQDALAKLDAQAANREFVQMKLDNLPPAPAPAPAPAATEKKGS